MNDARFLDVRVGTKCGESSNPWLLVGAGRRCHLTSVSGLLSLFAQGGRSVVLVVRSSPAAEGRLQSYLRPLSRAVCPGHDGKSRAGSQSLVAAPRAMLVIGSSPRRSDRSPSR